ncbi:MAG TPA: cytochrome d ubiquinol oxidase subunit II [Candidatus Acidoferrales bacterium]|jgi:cytochrome d ubiquinol oxidase subunit II|nr:cytochrome d ubiquinol oxidase subunit II [Candidatus Acidoferrales bacterium]
MHTLWFCLVAAMIAVYVLLDGFDIGAGIVHLGIARTSAERRAVLASIGPVWDANEVWLIAGGGVLFFAFPVLYASSFSGFYLPLMMVLWLLILRGASVEFRNHVDSPLWAPFWDVIFCFSSALLAIFFGAALGNVVRGVPLDAKGYFFEPLWTNFRLGSNTGILDWYTILVGIAAYLALAQHGALWVAHKTEGEMNIRARRIAKFSALGVALATLVVTAVTFRVQPQILANLTTHVWGFVFPAIAVIGLIGVFINVSGAASPKKESRAFYSSCAYLVGMLTSAAFGLYPNVLPARGGPDLSLTIYNSSTAEQGMRIGLQWWIPGMILASGYFIFLYRRFAGKVHSDGGQEHGY